MASRKKKRVAQLTQQRMGLIRAKLYRPRNFILFIPLIVFIIILYLFVSHTIFFAVVTSDSMSPTFKTGDLLLMQGKGYTMEEDDIIMFDTPEVRDLVIHRVDSISEDGISTRADATEQVDEWVISEDNIQAEVLFFNDKPIVLKNTGWYFIDNAGDNSAPFSDEMQFTSLMMMTLKNIGMILFISAVIMYLAFTARDIRYSAAARRR